MKQDLSRHYTDPSALAEAIVARAGKEIVLGLPLGLGKAPHIANALYDLAARDSSISLRIFTALTLEPPSVSSELERRFLEPVVARTMGGYPRFSYAQAQKAGELPANIEVNEFFFQAGSRMNSPDAQQSYISTNYTHAAQALLDRGVNVIAQLVAARSDQTGRRYSLSCNTDLTCDLLKARAAGRTDFLLVGQVNDELPFMTGEAEQPESAFAFILQHDDVEFPLFGAPKTPITGTEHAIGMHAAALVPDGGTIQLGIGALGDAVAHALLLRQRDAVTFERVLENLDPAKDAPERWTAPFDAGLYAATEMVVDCLLDLVREGVVKREVDGAVIHGGFFVGPRAFYRTLRDMSDAERSRIAMRGISFINELYGEEDRKRAARVKARFINSTMMVTMLGAAVSDQLEDGRVVSGVGGQYNFVSQAFALEGARSIIALPATRMHAGELRSNVVWSYGHVTIPRHLRDIVVTEYGVADLRGVNDARVVERLLAVADSRFQGELLEAAKKAGKIAPDFEIAERHRNNRPERIAEVVTKRDFPAFPFGTDFTAVEQRLLPALKHLKSASAQKAKLAALAIKGMRGGERPADEEAALSRMGLERAGGPEETFLKALLAGALAVTRAS